MLHLGGSEDRRLVNLNRSNPNLCASYRTNLEHTRLDLLFWSTTHLNYVIGYPPGGYLLEVLSNHILFNQSENKWSTMQMILIDK